MTVLPKDKTLSCWGLINRPMLLVVSKINPIEACYLQSGNIMGPRQLCYRNHTQLSSTNIQDIWKRFLRIFDILLFFRKTIPFISVHIQMGMWYDPYFLLIEKWGEETSQTYIYSHLGFTTERRFRSNFR